VTILIPPDRQYEEDAILKLIRRGDRVEHYDYETVRQRKEGWSIFPDLRPASAPGCYRAEQPPPPSAPARHANNSARNDFS
jgi:hypothetical protein